MSRYQMSEHAILTTEHAASSHGVPVLVYHGDAYEAADIIGRPEDGYPVTGAMIVASWALASLERTAEEIAAARAYCATWPEGPQVPEDPAAALGRRGRGAAKRRDVDYRALGRKGGAAGLGRKKPRREK